MKGVSALAVGLLWALSPQAISADLGRLGPDQDRFVQENFDHPGLTLEDIRNAGLKVFASPFNHADGYGDGPMDVEDTISPGGRPTLGNNGTFLRVNGLDAQSCVECHAMVSSSTTPPTFGVGGFGGLNDAPIFQPTVIDVADLDGSGFAFTDGRLIVPPHLFGSGGVQLLAEEMTLDLQAIADQALVNPGQEFLLISKGVDFGTISADNQGILDTSGVSGVNDDLIVRPFGRKGEFATVRDFDEGAMMFHHGMQPVEAVGRDVDGDSDGVVNELLIGEMSALEIFITTMDRPFQEVMDSDAVSGFVLFTQIGCSDCHRPSLSTVARTLSYRFNDELPHFTTDLSNGLTQFASDQSGGLVVPLYSDLKRHDMGPGLAESFQGASAVQNAEFITARLWGVGDSAPYLHDGRALNLDEAIRGHGGEAQLARDAYVSLTGDGQAAMQAFLQTLRLPQSPNQDVLNDDGP